MIAGLLLFIEAALILRYSTQDVSPFFMPTKRGVHAVVFKVKRLWILPAPFINSEYLITSFIPNRLQFQFGSTSRFIVVPIPVVIGFSQIIRSTYSDTSFPKFGRSIIFFGATVLVIRISAL